MQPKKTFTHFFKIQKTPDVDNRRNPGLSINTNAGIIYDNFEESFYRVQSENEGYKGTAPEKIIIAVNKNLTSPYQITKSYDKIEDFRAYIAKEGLETGGTGAKVRPVVSCKGTT